jgi:hypothetical protein
MKIRRKYIVGRYVVPDTGRAVNIHCGQERDSGCDVYYFIRSGVRVFVGNDFRKWEKERALP